MQPPSRRNSFITLTMPTFSGLVFLVFPPCLAFQIAPCTVPSIPVSSPPHIGGHTLNHFYSTFERRALPTEIGACYRSTRHKYIEYTRLTHEAGEACAGDRPFTAAGSDLERMKAAPSCSCLDMSDTRFARCSHTTEFRMMPSAISESQHRMPPPDTMRGQIIQTRTFSSMGVIPTATPGSLVTS